MSRGVVEQLADHPRHIIKRIWRGYLSLRIIYNETKSHRSSQPHEHREPCQPCYSLALQQRRHRGLRRVAEGRDVRLPPLWRGTSPWRIQRRLFPLRGRVAAGGDLSWPRFSERPRRHLDASAV